MSALFDFVWLVPLLSLAAAGGIALNMLFRQDRGDEAERPTARLAVHSAGLALLLMLALDGLALLYGTPGQVTAGRWLESGLLQVPLSFTLDALSLGFGSLVALLAFLTLKFSVNYMHREAGFHRFFMAMCLFVAGMQLIVLSGNAVLAFVGWELAGASSFLLIGYAYERPTATTNALRAFITNRIGDAGFIIGIGLAAIWLHSVEWSEIGMSGRMGTLAAGLLALGFVIAALAKSAQVPFAPWIARALEGPTPSSAIFYGAVMVHAGVYLMIRLQPLLVQTPTVMALLALVGLATALYGYLSGLTQSDVKSSLMFATTTQVGLMFFFCGIGWFELAAWHMGLHAAWRSYQFLAAPSYMHMVNGVAKAPPAWLSSCQRLYTAALQRFWLENMADWLLVRPTRAMARDARDLDDRVVSRLVGLPEDSALVQASVQPERPETDSVVRGYGLAGQLLVWVAEKLHGFERHLIFQQRDGNLSRLLQSIGKYLLAVETLLERPRYLLLLIMATLVVILR